MKNAILLPRIGIVRSVLTAAVAVAAFSGASVIANAQTLQFTPNAPLATENFSGLQIGSQITSIGWTNSVSTNPDATGVTPSGTAYPGGSEAVVVKNSSTTRNNISSPVMTLPDFGSSSVVYASGWIYHSSATTSGARVLLRYLEGGNPKYVGGFGILDSSASTFALYGSNGWNYSTEKAIDNHWYEIALVVQLDETDISLSKGYLFVRDATNGDTDFRLIDGLAGINMGYSATHQFTTFTSWRVEGFQGSAEIGALSLGTGTLQSIPEPGTVSLLLLSGLAVGGLRLRHRRNSVR